MLSGLEIAEWVMVGVIFAILIALTIMLSTPQQAAQTFAGFFTIGYIPEGVSIALIAALAGFAGCGGMGNGVVTSYYRDKGLGMGAKVGAIPSIIRGRATTVSPWGRYPRVSPENTRRFKLWRKYAIADIIGIFLLGSFIGMFLPCNLALSVIPIGTKMGGWDVAAFIGKYIMERIGYIGWVLVLITGFWVLFSTQLGQCDVPIRIITDILWTSSERIRKVFKNDVKKLYYILLTFEAIWMISAFIIVYIYRISPLWWLILLAIIGNVPMVAMAGVTIYVNNKFLPKEYKPSIWWLIALALGFMFWMFLFVEAIAEILGLV